MFLALKTLGRHHQKLKTGVISDPLKRTYVLQNFLKRKKIMK